MDPVTMFLISAGLDIGQQMLSNAGNLASEIKQAEAQADYIEGQLALSEAQEEDYANQFDTTITTQYGTDFLSLLTSGEATASELIASIGADTSFGKQLQNYETQASLALSNAQLSIGQSGISASRQGALNALSAQGLSRQAAQASGQASSAQAVSGIRADRGTGSNLTAMQDAQNELARKQLVQQIENQNRDTIVGMRNTELSASQQADQLRTQAEISELNAVESALVDYDVFKDNMDIFQLSQDNMQADIDYWNDEADVGFWEGLSRVTLGFNVGDLLVKEIESGIRTVK